MGLFDMFAGKAINQVGNSVKQAVKTQETKPKELCLILCRKAMSNL